MAINEPVPAGSTKLTAGQVIRIVIPFAVLMLLTTVESRGYFASYHDTWFFRYKGDGVPWYFIGQELVEALWKLGCSAAGIAFCWAAARYLGAAAWMAMSLESLDLAQSLCSGVNIALHTSDVWDPARAASTWASFDSFVQSRSLAYITSYAVALPLIMWCFLRFARDAKAGKF